MTESRALILTVALTPVAYFSDYFHLLLACEFVLLCALIPALLFAMNVFVFRRPGRGWNRRVLPPVSVLIPARNEENSIGDCLESLLASRGVEFEVIVLDDGSTDRTREMADQIAGRDLRVRVEAGSALPDGWNGKQFACWSLASLASHDVFCFLDADVRVEKEALYRMVSELNYLDGRMQSGEEEKDLISLVSGFPRQETGTWMEILLLPLIHFVLLGFLPLLGERWSRRSGFAAGCGQFVMVRREAYFATGGHSAIRNTMHDGLLLPVLFRRYCFRTGVYDLSKDAVCRMYHNAGEVWRGLGKNATEGMASLARLPVFTALLLVGQVMPIPAALWAMHLKAVLPLRIALFALALGMGVRAVSALRYRQNWLGAMLHPIGVLILLVLQWYALVRKIIGKPATWKERAYQVG
jgi:cellulose synthase/poly-beta-1,6-N-acetylglucosamine synthase-like glycosyltransferase